MLDCSVRQQQTILMLEVGAGLGCALNHLLSERPVLGMYALREHIQGRLLGTLVLEDAVGFI